MLGRFLHATPFRRVFLPLALLVLAMVTAAAIAASSGTPPWPMSGQNIANTRAGISTISPANAQNLALKWKFTTHGDVSATPAVVGGSVYFPDWGHFVNGASEGGYLYKLDAKTGSLTWSHKISEYDNVPGAVSRTSPAVQGDTLYIGDQNGAHLIAVDTATGNARWTTALDNRFDAIITQAPIVHDGVVYVGAASLEEGLVAFIPGYPCCSFRGFFAAVDAATGQILWKTYTVPNIPGYSGGGVWSSTAAIDPSTRTVYISTGNNYSVPQSAKDCQQNGGTAAQCLAADNYIDSIIALNMDTGAVKWAHALQGFDDWNVACIPGFIPDACPEDAGPDFDFGSGPNLFTIRDGNRGRKVVGAGQKSGRYWLLDAATGDVVWWAAPAPGSTLGGIEWGTATDGERIYVVETNYFHIPYTIPGAGMTTAGSFAALDAKTGALAWQIADPRASADPLHAHPLGPATVANGVVYVGSMTGYMYAIDAKTGAILWQYQGEGASNAGPAISDGTLYWGNGYNHLGIPEGSPSTSFYAFSLNGK